MSDVLDRLQSALADRYTIERELGRGGMAVVYLAQDLRLERRVAIKVLRPELTSVVTGERFVREIKLTANLHHPHILALHEAGEADGLLYYVMPLVGGESLREKLNREEQLPVDEAVRIASEVADALSYAHEQNLLHRDIKPENILLEAGHAVVADFGIARALSEAAGERLTDTGLGIGTPIYMSPEQAAGERELSEASDVYSLACVLYEMLTGEPPVMDSSVQTIVSRKLLGEFRRVSDLRHDVSEEIDAAASRALATDPAERIASAREFVEALGGVRERATERPRTRPKEVLGTGLRQLTRPPAILGVALALGVLGAAGVWVATRGGGEAPIVEPGWNSVAVLPFRVTGADLDVVWREGLMDVLAANLDGVGDLRVVDTRTVLSRWRSRVGAADAPAETALRVARELGARWTVLGQAVELGGRVRLDARLYTSDGTEPVATSNVAGPPDSILPLLQGLTLDVLKGLSGERGLGDRGRALTSTSLEAVKEFLEGEQELRRSEFRAAAERFERALEIDSTFALAAARLFWAHGWQFRFAAAIEASAQAMRFADRLPARDRGLLELDHLLIEGRLEMIDLARQLTARYADNPEVWYLLGEAYVHLGNVAVIPVDERLAPFERAIALDSSFTLAWIHPIQSAARDNQRDRFDRVVDLYLARDSSSEFAGSLRAALALLHATGPDSAAAIGRLASLSDRQLSYVYERFWFSTQPKAAALVAYEMAAPHRPSDERVAALFNSVNLTEVWRGRYAAAQAALNSARELAPESPTVLIFQLWNILHGLGDTALAPQAIERARRLEPPGSWFLLTLAILYLKNGDEARALAFADTLDLLADSLGTVSDSLGAVRRRGQALGLRGLVAERRGDHRRAVDLLRAAIPATGYGWGWNTLSVADLQMGLARALLELGEEAEALRILDSGFYLDYYYDAPAALARAQIYERRGEREKAIRAYARLVELWKDADPELQPQVEAARHAIEALSTDR